ncbi:MAG: hypothetical protein R2702_03625 [Acidimicrobiales bacterium]
MLVTVLLMSFGFAILYGSLFTATKITEANKRRTIASQGVQAWAEGTEQAATRLEPNNSAYTYQACALPASYGQLALPSNAVPNAWRNDAANLAPVSIEYLTGFDGTGQPTWTPSQPACEGTGDKGLQKITLRLKSPAGTTPVVQETLVVIKRNAACPADTTTFENPDLGPC